MLKVYVKDNLRIRRSYPWQTFFDKQIELNILKTSRLNTLQRIFVSVHF